MFPEAAGLYLVTLFMSGVAAEHILGESRSACVALFASQVAWSVMAFSYLLPMVMGTLLSRGCLFYFMCLGVLSAWMPVHHVGQRR